MDYGPICGLVLWRTTSPPSKRNVTETWHEDSSSGYHCIDAARPIPSDTRVDTVDFQNHGGLAFVHRNTVAFRERHLDCNVTMFEYLCGYAVAGDSHIVLLGVVDRGVSKLAVIVHRCLHSKYLTDVVSLSWILLVVSDCAQLTIASWMYCAIDGQHSAV